MIVAKLHRRGNDLLLAVCDKKLLGKKLNDDVFIDPHFYGNETINEQELISLMKDATIINLFGNETIDIAIKFGHCTKDTIRLIDNVAHVQIVKMM